MNILYKINNILKWEPYNIFYSTEFKWYKHEPRLEGNIFTGFYTSTSSYYENYNYTKIGKLFNKMPILFELFLKTIYYIITWPLYLSIKIHWIFFKGFFIPQKYLD